MMCASIVYLDHTDSVMTARKRHRHNHHITMTRHDNISDMSTTVLGHSHSLCIKLLERARVLNQLEAQCLQWHHPK